MDLALTTLAFILGLGAEGFLAIRNKNENTKPFAKIFLLMVIAMGAVIALQIEWLSDASSFLLYLAIPGVMFFSYRFRNHVLPVINEQMLLSLLIITVFILFVYAPGIFECLPMQVCIGLPALIILLLAFTPIKPGRRLRLAVYVLFIFASILFALFQLSFLAPDAFSRDNSVSPLEQFPLVVSSGMIFFGLGAYAIMLLELLPVSSEIVPLSRRMDEIREHVTFLSDKYSAYQMNPFHAAATIVVLGGILFLNHSLQIVPDLLLANISFLLAFHSGTFLENFRKD